MNKPKAQIHRGKPWNGKAGKGKTAEALHFKAMREINPGGGPGNLWVTTQDIRRVRVMAVAEGWAMVRRPGCAPYLCPISELFEMEEQLNYEPGEQI